MTAVLTPTEARTLAQPWAANDHNAPGKLREFVVSIKNGGEFITVFTAMGLNKVSLQKSHEGLCGDGEQCVVYTRAEFDFKFPVRKGETAEQRSRRESDAAQAVEHRLGLTSMGDAV